MTTSRPILVSDVTVSPVSLNSEALLVVVLALNQRHSLHLILPNVLYLARRIVPITVNKSCWLLFSLNAYSFLFDEGKFGLLCGLLFDERRHIFYDVQV